MHPATGQATELVAQWFTSDHLPDDSPQKLIAEACEKLASIVTYNLYGTEVTVGLRKLLEAKDCFVRQAIANEDETGKFKH
jgi:hypothetical protein